MAIGENWLKSVLGSISHHSKSLILRLSPSSPAYTARLTSLKSAEEITEYISRPNIKNVKKNVIINNHEKASNNPGFVIFTCCRVVERIRLKGTIDIVNSAQ